jgi:hypothetical protein
MFQPVNIIKISIVIALGIILQVLFIAAEDTNTPEKVSLAFTKAYYSLDKDVLDELVCSELAEEGETVDQYIQRVEKEANDTGFKLYSKSLIYHVTAHITRIDDSEAQVKITGKRRHSVNPVYTLVAIIFQIGEVYYIDETIDLINEEGRWKVCGSPFSLII